MKTQSGFTLIELVIVIIILGVLSATAIPKFINLQDDAREGAMNGLKSSLESVVTLTYAKSAIQNVENENSATLSLGSSYINVRYGYPQATQSNLRKVLNFTDDADGVSGEQGDWKMSGSGTAVTFTLYSDAETAELSEPDIEASVDICKLVYNQSVYNSSTKTGDRPVITVSGCND